MHLIVYSTFNKFYKHLITSPGKFLKFILKFNFPSENMLGNFAHFYLKQSRLLQFFEHTSDITIVSCVIDEPVHSYIISNFFHLYVILSKTNKFIGNKFFNNFF